MWVSQDGGQAWTQITANAAWSSRSLFAYTTIPLTNIVILAGGRLSTNAAPAFNASDVWMCEDGIGQTWTQRSTSSSVGALQASALVGLYDRTLVLTGGLRNGTVVADVWTSSDLGQTWQLQPGTVGARAYHAMAVDADDIVYVIGGQTALNAYVSNTKGASWVAVAVATSDLLYACAYVRQVNAVKQLILYGGQNSAGQAQGWWWARSAPR